MPLAVVPVRDRTLNRVLKRGVDQRLHAGCGVWAIGADDRRCVLVREGLLLLVDGEGKGTELIGPGELTGLEGLEEAPVRRTGARALTDLDLLWVEGPLVLQALRRARRTLPILLEALREEAGRARRVAAGAGGRAAGERLWAVLLDLSRRLGDPDRWLPEGIPHRVLGELARVHRSTVTTELNAWIYEGALEQSGRRIRVADRKPGQDGGGTRGSGRGGRPERARSGGARDASRRARRVDPTRPGR